MKKLISAVFAAVLLGFCCGVGAQMYVNNTFSLTARSAITQFPVAVLRPTGQATIAALDIVPTAGAVPHPDNGFTWVDACDADVLHANGGTPVSCARMGIKPDRVEFGSRSFDGSTPRDVYIIRDRQVVARFHQGGLDVYGTIRARNFVNQ